MTIYTSSFERCGTNPKAVAISRGVPGTYTGVRYPPLYPSEAMLKAAKKAEDNGVAFAIAYRLEILHQLDPLKILEDVGPGAILLCWEKFNKQCHRRLVAEWIETETGIIVAEFGRQRTESLAYKDSPVQPSRWAKKKPITNLLLF